MKTSRFAFLLTAALSLTALSSCGGEKLPPKEKVDHVYKTTEVDIGNISYASEILTVGDEIIIRANKILDQEEGTVERHIIRHKGNRQGRGHTRTAPAAAVLRRESTVGRDNA